jgi:type II restriction enzyme
MYYLSDYEKKILKRVSQPYYMTPPLKHIESILQNSKEPKSEWRNIFDKLYEILTKSKDEVEKLLKERVEKGEIKDIDQARKSIVGNAFSNLFIYTFLKNKIYENIKSTIFINNRISEIKGFKNIATIRVGSETQKPDVDIVIFTQKSNGLIDKSIILSLKTSLRERAGQTYKWKLLLEIATSDNPIKEKYEISYQTQQIPYICFATVNFYNEIDNPQYRGMFKFFDEVFIAKPIERDFIKPLSKLIDFVNDKL